MSALNRAGMPDGEPVVQPITSESAGITSKPEPGAPTDAETQINGLALAVKIGVPYAADQSCKIGVPFVAFTEGELKRLIAALSARNVETRHD